jgi:hypothetical protein
VGFGTPVSSLSKDTYARTRCSCAGPMSLKAGEAASAFKLAPLPAVSPRRLTHLAPGHRTHIHKLIPHAIVALSRTLDLIASIRHERDPTIRELLMAVPELQKMDWINRFGPARAWETVASDI